MIPNFKPLNPWGRAMPKAPDPLRQTLYQVCVKTAEGKMVRIGPMMLEDMARSFLAEITKAILDGREKSWSDAHLIVAKA